MRSKAGFVAVVASVVLALGVGSAAQNAGLAATPPMGWNSWDSYGLTITEDQFRENVAVQAKTLLPAGYRYAVIDEGWFLRNPEDRPTPEKLQFELDANGRYIPVPARFASAMQGGVNTGFNGLGEYVHAQGLKFGIHIVRGIPRESVARKLAIAGSNFAAQDAADQTDACPWDPTNWGVKETPAGQAWYDSLIAQYASWGVDYLKVDCISDHPYKPGEIRMIHRAIAKGKRPMVLSLSPGPTSPGVAQELIPLAQMWRISDDVWDYWRNPRAFPRTLYGQFELAASWAPYARAGTWPDADMLPLGYLGPVPGEGSPRETRLTHDEQRTMMSLWAMLRSPLIVGANLTKLDDWTKELLTNKAVLAVDQESHGGRQVAKEGETIAWTAAGQGDVRYLAIFNLSDKPATVQHPYGFYNLPAKAYKSRELWTGAEAPGSAGVELQVGAHGCVLMELQPAGI